MGSEFLERMNKPAEIAERLGISPVTLKKWRLRDEDYGPEYKRLPGGDRAGIRYPESKFLEWCSRDTNATYSQELARRPPDEEPGQPAPAPVRRYDTRLGRTVVDRGGAS